MDWARLSPSLLLFLILVIRNIIIQQVPGVGYYNLLLCILPTSFISISLGISVERCRLKLRLLLQSGKMKGNVSIGGHGTHWNSYIRYIYFLWASWALLNDNFNFSLSLLIWNVSKTSHGDWVQTMLNVYGLKQHYAAFFSAECLKIRVKACALNRSIFT